MRKIYFFIFSCIFTNQISFGQVNKIDFVLNSETNVFTDSQSNKDFINIPYQGFSKEQIHKSIILSFLRHTCTNPKDIYEADIENIIITHCVLHIPYLNTIEEMYNIQIKIESDKIILFSPVFIKTNDGKWAIPYNYNTGRGKDGKFINKNEEKNYAIQTASINAILQRIFNDALRKN